VVRQRTHSVKLTTFWLQSPLPHSPLGFGVTAGSLADALDIIHALDYGHYLPDDLVGVRIAEGIIVAELDQPHVVTNMGPINVRGMWYPFGTLGVPGWAAERIIASQTP